MNHFCTTHQVEYARHEKEGKEWYSHAIAGGGWCNETKAKAPSTYTPKIQEKIAEIREKLPPAPLNLNPYDLRSHRIERQHSQHMALLYFQTIGESPTPEQVKEITDWFESDLDN